MFYVAGLVARIRASANQTHASGAQPVLGVVPGAGAAVAGVTHDLHADAVSLLDGLGALGAVGTVGVELLQPSYLVARLGDDFGCRVSILNTGGGDRPASNRPIKSVFMPLAPSLRR